MFWFKRKKIIVDSFVTNESYIKYSPIDKAAKHLPDWFKNTPSLFHTGISSLPTIKHCDGILNLYKNTFIIPLWTDIALNIKNKKLQCYPADDTTFMNSHPHQQWETFASPSKFAHLKLQSPWHLKTKENIYWLFNNVFWESAPNSKIYNIANGKVEYKHQSTTNINMFVDLEKDCEYTIPFNTPLVQLIPLTEKNVEIKHHVVSEKEWNNYKIPRLTFINSYGQVLKAANKKKCPFGFGDK